MKRGLVVLACGLLAGSPMTVLAEEGSTDPCPEALETSQSANPPEGWEVGRSGEKGWFANIELSDGHPRERVFLAPDKTREDGDFFVNSWDVAWIGERGLWLTCAYQNTDVVLIKRLPAGTKSCEAIYEQPNDRATPELQKFSCRP